MFERIGAATKDGVTRACLQDMQVMRSIGTGADESDMLQHAVQTANNTAVYHLIQAGYDAQYLTATLIKKVQEERVTEPNTVARQLALTKAKGHGGRFHVTNWAHMTCNDLFIAVEMSVRCNERAEDEKKKKLALRCQDVEDKALTILQQGRSVQSLNVKELDVLLAWHQAPKVSGAKKADKLVQWQNIVASEKAPPLFARWTNDDEERMNGLTTESISITDTHYGQHAALIEKELGAAVDSMRRDKRNKLRQKLDECEMEGEATYVGGEQAQGTVSADGETGAV